jgi:hypothetical protein
VMKPWGVMPSFPQFNQKQLSDLYAYVSASRPCRSPRRGASRSPRIHRRGRWLRCRRSAAPSVTRRFSIRRAAASPRRMATSNGSSTWCTTTRRRCRSTAKRLVLATPTAARSAWAITRARGCRKIS